jgi:hypothetical protein
MLLNLTVDDQKWSWLLSKAALTKDDPFALATAKLIEYLDACGRDIGADDMAKVQAALADPVKFAIAKAALGL